MKKVDKFIKERIRNQQRKIVAISLESPRIKEIEGNQIFVVDVQFRSNKQIIRDVPIAQNNRNILNFVSEGTPVELVKFRGGQFSIIGRSNTTNNEIKTKFYAPQDLGLMFSQGIKLIENGGNTYETGQNNTTQNFQNTQKQTSIIKTPLTYGQISPYGTKTYGAKNIQVIEVLSWQ